MEPVVTRPIASSASAAIAATPRRSMSFIVYMCTPELRTRSFSRSSRFRTPIERRILRQHGRRETADARQFRRLRTHQRRQRHSVHVATGGAGRCVHVAVRVNPEQPDGLLCRSNISSRGRDRAGRQAVIAAEHEGEWRPRRARRAPSDRASRTRAAISLMNFFWGRRASSFRESVKAGRPCRRRRVRARRFSRRCRRCGTPTAPCRPLGGCLPGRGGRQ